MRLWLRRSTTTRALPALVAVAVVILFGRNGWQFEWNCAMNQASTSTILLGPLLAGLVAFDRARRLAPTFELLGTTAPRPAWWALPLASWLAAVAAWSVTVGLAALRVASHGAGGSPDPWVLLQAPTSLAGAAALGTAIGSRVSSPLAAVVASVCSYGSTVLGLYLGLPGFMAAGGATGSLIGSEQVPVTALSGISANVGVVVTCLLMERAALRGRRAHRLTAAVAAVLLVAGLLTYGATFGRGDTYRASGTAQSCVGNRPVVCGPQDGRAVLVIAQHRLHEAVARLRGSGLPWRDRYVLASGTGELALPLEAGLLTVDPATIDGDRLSTADLTSTLATPRMCAGFFGGPSVDDLLGQQQLLRDWIEHAISGDTGPAPPNVRAAYAALSTCPPARG